MKRYLLFFSISLIASNSFSQNRNKLDIFSLNKQEQLFNEKCKKIGLSQTEVDSLKKIMQETMPLLVSNSHQTDSNLRSVEFRNIIKNRNSRLKKAISAGSYHLIQDSLFSNRKRILK